MATRIVRHSSQAGEWLSATRAPDARLRGIVHDYSGYEELWLGFNRRLEVPSSRVPLIVGFGPPFEIRWPDERRTPAKHRSFVAGMSDQYALVGADGPAHCLEVQLSPIGMHLILGLPMHELTNRTADLRDVLGAEAGALGERLYEAADWESRFAILDGFLLQCLARVEAPHAGVARAWAALRQCGGCLEIGRLAESAGWSQKHLIAQFREQIGLPPKLLARVLRFGRAVRVLGSAEPPAWTELAAQCGYYDQAHLIRDFHRFAGSTPKEFLRRCIPDGGGVIGDEGPCG